MVTKGIEFSFRLARLSKLLLQISIAWLYVFNSSPIKAYRKSIDIKIYLKFAFEKWINKRRDKILTHSIVMKKWTLFTTFVCFIH